MIRSESTVEDPAFSILMVCEGNICRSPLAEQLFRARIGEAGLHTAVTVSSAGLSALVGAEMEPMSSAMSRKFRGVPSDFRARQIALPLVAQADVILAMTRKQRDSVVHQFPRALQRTFSLVEFTKLASIDASRTIHEELMPPDPSNYEIASFTNLESEISRQLRKKATELGRVRSQARLQSSDDIKDPFRQRAEVHEAVAQQISLAVTQLVHNLVAFSAEIDSSDKSTQ